MGTAIYHEIKAEAGMPLALPDNAFIADVQMARAGHALLLTAADGRHLNVSGYFAQATPPDLVAPNGAKLTPHLVAAFTPPEHAGQYAANNTGTMTDQSPAGRVTAVAGEAHIVRADGTRVDVKPGTPIFQNDVIETGKNGAVNMLFADHTAFAVGESAKMSIDKYAYSDAQHTGSSFFSMLQGVFVYTSGLIGKNDPGAVNVETPVGTIGIRGTAFVGEIDPHDYGLHDPHAHGRHQSVISLWDGAGYVQNDAAETAYAKRFATYAFDSYDQKPQAMPDMNPKEFVASHKMLFSLIDEPWWENLIKIYDQDHHTQQGLNERLYDFLDFHYAPHMPAADSPRIGGDIWAMADSTQRALVGGAYAAGLWTSAAVADFVRQDDMAVRSDLVSPFSPHAVAYTGGGGGGEPATNDVFTFNYDQLLTMVKSGTTLDAGAGTDTLVLAQSPGDKGFPFDMVKVFDGTFRNFEKIELGPADGKSAQKLTLDAKSVFDFTGPEHTLTIYADTMKDISSVKVIVGKTADEFQLVSGDLGKGDVTFRATIEGHTVTLVIQNQEGAGGHGQINVSA